jgi:hypothetical protein
MGKSSESAKREQAERERAARDHWATMAPEEQVEALRRGYTPFAHTKKKPKPQQRKKGDPYAARRVTSSGFETNRRRH